MEHVVSKVSIVVKDMKYTYQPHFMDLITALQKFGGAIRLSPESGNEEPNSKWDDSDNLTKGGGNCLTIQQ